MKDKHLFDLYATHCMKVAFRRLKKTDFAWVRDLAGRSWVKTYSHLPSKDLLSLVEKYYSDSELEKCRKRQSQNKAVFLIATAKKRVGYCHADIQAKKAELCRLYVEPAKTGKGIGTELLQKAERFLKNRKVRCYFTFVNHRNSRGLNFYLKNGFERVPKKDRDDEFEKKALWYLEKKVK